VALSGGETADFRLGPIRIQSRRRTPETIGTAAVVSQYGDSQDDTVRTEVAFRFRFPTETHFE